MARLVVFDLDGTLIDSRRDLAESANELLACYGAGPLAVDRIGGMVGDGARELVERALAVPGIRTDVDVALDRFLEIYDRRLLDHTVPYEGLTDLVRTMSSDCPLAILTNKPSRATERVLAAFGLLAAFRWVIGGDSAFPRKPDPAALRDLMAKAGTTPDTTLMVGDSMVDVETARRAPTRVLVALYGLGGLRGPMALTPGEARADTPLELAGLVRRFASGAPVADPPSRA